MAKSRTKKQLDKLRVLDAKITHNPKYCAFCGGEVSTMAFIGTGFCSSDCQRGREHDPSRILRKT